jgi:hypothetical protein
MRSEDGRIGNGREADEEGRRHDFRSESLDEIPDVFVIARGDKMEHAALRSEDQSES